MRAVVLGFALLLSAGGARAETLRIDSGSSHASFSLRALWVKRIGGDFTRVEGVIERNRVAGRFSVDVRVAADSVAMEKQGHADWARSADFFDTVRYPWIQFRADDLPESLLREGGAIDGELTLRGVTRPMRFMLEASECPRPGIDCAVRAQGEVQRGEFGMDARRFVLSDRVTLDFAIRVLPDTAAAAPASGG
jgi:polyisoprenoid-binding protein YceI